MRLLRVVILGLGLVAAGCGDDEFNGLPDAPDGDADNDGIPDAIDNCPLISNADQVDTDGDSQGDACDDDDDNDGILDAVDNCPLVANPTQANADNDADGDACDGDADGDGVADASDNCPEAANADQVDTDSDGQGDGCDADDDNDTILDALDNCVVVANQAQDNTDEDTNGDACDDDDDNDTILDVNDNCPLNANSEQENLDEDTLGDACDDDADGDTVLDADDNCLLLANPTQANADEDELGDDCDPDDDNDEIDDDVDNCVLVANTDQANLDGDASGDVCDDDDDNDGTDDGEDNCPDISNEDQADSDQNGVGDACEKFTPSFEAIIPGGNITSVGAGFAGRSDGTTGGEGTVTPAVDLVIETLPANAEIVEARLYWTVIGQAFPTLTFEGQSVTGIETGQTPDTCWDIGNNFQYRADVTSLVTGNDTYTASDLLSNAAIGPDGQGISLVIIYKDPADPRNNYIGISDGGIGINSLTGASPPAVTVTTDGFTVGAGFDKVTVTNLVADGQFFGDEILFAAGQGQFVSFGDGNAFGSTAGSIYDNRVDDISSLFAGGETSFQTTVNGFDDCLSWSMSSVVIEDVDDDTADGPVELAVPTVKAKAPQVKAPLVDVPGSPSYRGKK